MSLFKVLRGDSSRIDIATTPFHDGYAYFTPNNGMFYIDAMVDGVAKRIQLNAYDAEKISGATLATVLNESDLEIPTSKAVALAISTAIADANISGKINTHNTDTTAHSDIRQAASNAASAAASAQQAASAAQQTADSKTSVIVRRW